MTISTMATKTTHTIVSEYTFKELWEQAFDTLIPSFYFYQFVDEFVDEYAENIEQELLKALQAALSLSFEDCAEYGDYEEEMYWIENRNDDDEDRERVVFDMKRITPLIEKFESIRQYFPIFDGGNNVLRADKIKSSAVELLEPYLRDYTNFDIVITEEECDDGYNITVEVGDIPSSIHREFISSIFD